jgi:hypothetical protein
MLPSFLAASYWQGVGRVKTVEIPKFRNLALLNRTRKIILHVVMAATSDIPLSPWERGEKTRAEMAAELGVTERHLRRLLARDREMTGDGTGAADWDESDHPYLAITGDPTAERGACYYLASDRIFGAPDADGSRAEIDSGRVRIGDHNGRRLLIRSVNGGAPVEREPAKKEPPKFKPKARKKRKRALIDT